MGVSTFACLALGGAAAPRLSNYFVSHFWPELGRKNVNYKIAGENGSHFCVVAGFGVADA